MSDGRHLPHAERPASIRWFERLILCAITIDLFNNLASWTRIADRLSSTGTPPNPLVILLLVCLPPAVGLILWYLVARRRSGPARWITIVLVTLGSIGFVAAAIRQDGDSSRLFLIASFAEMLKFAAICFLLARSSAAWVARPVLRG